MISEYHMACVTRGSPVTSPILPRVIKDKLPPLTGYALPEDRSGVTDVRVRDHQARTLQVAVWLHRLDMALSEEPAASGSLVWARHSLGHLLVYFLAPGTAWGLQFEDVVDQVLWENRKQNKRRHDESSSSLRKCRSRRTKLRDEFDAVLKTMEVITDGQSRREMEKRLAALQTSLNVVENSITKFKNLIEDCRMVEEELCQIEEDEARQEEETHKCQFFKKKIVYMGLEFQVKDDKVCYTPLKDKCETIQNLDSPKTLKQTRAFCGMVNFLSLFLPNLR